MAAAKKAQKSKLITDDKVTFRNQSQFIKDSPKGKKPQKRPRNEDFEEEDMASLISQYQASIKKKKVEADVDTTESRQKILDLVSSQLEARRKCNENLLKGLSEITTQIDNDYNAIKENEQKLEHLTASFMKCIQQAGIAYKQKVKGLKEIYASFKKESEEIEASHKTETENVVGELEYDIKKLQNKLIAESKRSSWESLRRSIFHAMQNDL